MIHLFEKNHVNFRKWKEMSTKIHIVFLSTVGLHPTSGDWRHWADRGCLIICMCIYSYCLWVLTTTYSMHSRCVSEQGHTHTPMVCASWNTSTHTQVPTTQSNDGQVCCILCYESISDKSMRYNLNLSISNSNENNMLLFSDSFLYYFQWTSIF